MNVYLVYHFVQYEFNDVIGVFDSYDKARSYELNYIKDHNVNSDYEGTEIRKVEVNKDYSDNFGELGEEV